MTDPQLVRITERAAAKINEILHREGIAGHPLRVRVVQTHCMGGRGHAYDLRASDAKGPEDEAAASNGVTLIVDRESAALLRGTELDYAESLEGSGFKFTNPNATGKCPCGHHELFE